MKRMNVLMRRLILIAVHQESKETATEEFLNFAQVVMAVNGHQDYFKAIHEAKGYLRSFSHYHEDNVYQVVNEFYSLDVDAYFGGNILNDFSAIKNIVSA